MDNVRFHHDLDIIEDIKKCGHYILYIVTSSYELNPIEYVFSIWKSNVRIVEQTKPVVDIIEKLIFNQAILENAYK